MEAFSISRLNKQGTMIFRPLSVDNCTRAREVLAIESDLQARRAEARILSHSSCLTSSGDGEGVDDSVNQNSMLFHGADLKSSDDSPPIKESDLENTSNDCVRADEVRASLGGRRDARTRSPKSINTILTMLRPAIQPSECAPRQISPVIHGPVRNRLLQVDSVDPVLGGLVERHSQLENEKIFAVVSSLQSGRSRFDGLGLEEDDECHENVIFPLRFDSGRHNVRDNSFEQTMMAFYSSDDIYREYLAGIENKAAEHRAVKDSSQAKSVILKHQPFNLEKLLGLKELHSTAATTSYAESLSAMFQRGLTTVSSDRNSNALTVDEEHISILPKMLRDGTHAVVDSMDRPVLQMTFDQRSNEFDLSRKRPYPCNYLEAMDDVSGYIRLDPKLLLGDEFKGMKNESSRNSKKMLEKICSAHFVSKHLRHPHRFEKGHDIFADLSHFRVSLNGPMFRILDNAVKSFKDTANECVSILKSRECYVEWRGNLLSRIGFPRKISLESSIQFIDHDTDSAKQKPDWKKIVSRLASMSRQCSFSPTFKHKGVASQNRSVASSRRVSEIRVLQNMFQAGRAPCLFLPQIKYRNRAGRVHGKSSEDQPEKRDLISQAVHWCVPTGEQSKTVEVLKHQQSNYPIENWFSSGTRVLGSKYNESGSISDIQNETLNSMRNSFCQNAQARMLEERYRTQIMTGCNARRSGGAVYSYHGFLTNQRVDPEVYKGRYESMLQLQKTNRQKKRAATRVTSFSEMSSNILVRALLREKAADTVLVGKTGKQIGCRLRTKRHESLELVCEINQDPLNSEPTGDTLILAHIPRLASLSWLRCYTKSADNIMEVLGETFKLERGELLHLLTKAHELEEEERAYRKDFGVFSRGDAECLDQDFFEDLCNFEDEVHEKAGFDGRSFRKRKELSGSVQDKKKRKKSKKKNKDAKDKAARKKDRKKRRDEKRKQRKRKEINESLPDDVFDVTKRTKVDTSYSTAGPDMTDACLRTAERVPFKQLQLEITPVVNPRRKNIRAETFIDSKSSSRENKKQAPAEEITEVIYNANTACQPRKESIPKCLSIVDSPDAIASLNEDKAFCSVSKPNTYDVHSLEPKEKNDGEHINNYRRLLNDGGSKVWQDSNILSLDEVNDAKENTEINREAAGVSDILPEGIPATNQLVLLTSESFLEGFPDAVAELASGRWVRVLSSGDALDPVNIPNKNVLICDSPLVDIAGVDVELADRGVVVQRLSAWIEGNQEIVGSRAFVKQLVLLAASGRYKSLHVLLCLDIDVSSTVSSDVVTLQNALAQQSGCPCEVAFEFVAPRMLSSSLVLLLLSNQVRNRNIADLLSDENTVERAKFLMSLVPTMTVHMALTCLGCTRNEDHQGVTAAEELQKMLRLAHSMGREEFVKNVNLSDTSASQLWLSLHVDISYSR